MRNLIGVALVAVLLGCATPPAATAQADAVAEVDAKRAQFVDFYRAGDVSGIAGHYHPDATFAGTLQPFWLEGQDAIQDLWTRFFAAWPNRNLIFRQPTVRVYGDTSVETGYMEMYMARDAQPPVITYIRYSITRVREKDDWQIINMNVARLPGSS